MGMPSCTLLWVNVIVTASVFLLHVYGQADIPGDTAAKKLDGHGRILAESDFLWDTDSWTAKGIDGLTHISKMIKATDDGPQLWYFVAPEKFLGNKRQAYGGMLSFRHGFFEYDSQGKDIMSGEMDVILVSEANDLMIGKRGLIPAWEFSSEHRLELSEMAGWLLSPSNAVPSRLDMIRLLSKLSGIWIRGGYYAGREDSYIMDVKLIAGPEDDKGPQKSSLRQQIISDTQIDPNVAIPTTLEENIATSKPSETVQANSGTRQTEPPVGKEQAKEQVKEQGKGMFGRILSGLQGGNKEKEL